MKRTLSSQDTLTMKPQAKRRAALCTIAILLVLYLIVTWIGQSFFVTRSYTVSDERIHDEIRIALLTDLHASLWGAGQSKLLAAIDEAQPDIIVLCGDIVNMNGSFRNAKTLLAALGKKYACYYVPGNHEYQSKRAEEILSYAESCGIPVFSGESELLTFGDTTFRLSGLDDPKAGAETVRVQRKRFRAELKDGTYTVLAVHRPNQITAYLKEGFDLVLCGHTHGGQVRIPYLLNGLYAPEQGLFPAYAGGRYDFDRQTLIISRGLSKKPLFIPRVFNQPELVIVTLSGTA